MLQSQYRTVLRNLIQSPTSPIPLLPDALLDYYVNLARRQVALDAECIRGNGVVTIGGGVVDIPVTALAGLGTATLGIDQAVVVRNAQLDGVRVDIRPWDWFAAYYWNGPPNPPVLPEVIMAHQGQGTFSTLFIYSPGGGGFYADVVFLPVDLASDATPDAVPYPWQDAVPFWGAYYSYMTMQRQADGNMFLLRYHELVRRGRTDVTSTNLPENDPGGVGALLATTKTTLGAAPPAPPRGRGGA